MAADRRSRISKHSMLVAGHPTSVSLEDAFWQRLRVVAAARGTALAALVATVDAGRGEANLSSAIRVFLLEEALSVIPGQVDAGASPRSTVAADQ